MSEETTKIKHANVRLATFILLIILVAIAFGGAGYLYGINAGKTLTSATKTVTATASATSSKTAVASATSTADVTASWKTYSNTKYGYSVKYPASAKYTEISPTGTSGPDLGYIVDFDGVNGITIRIEAQKNTLGSKTLSEFVNTSGSPMNVTDRKIFSEIMVNGAPAYKYIDYLNGSSTDKKTGSTILLLSGDYYYQIETGSQYTPEFTKDLENKFDQFVSTFQFTK